MRANAITVILVDDHPVVRSGYRRLLEGSENIVVVGEAGSGEEGVNAYFELKPDVLVMDVNMPGMNGLDAVRQIMARDSHAKVLVFSFHDNEAMLNQAMKAGVRGYLTKRSAPEAMVGAITDVAEGKIFIDPVLLQKRADQEEDDIPNPSEVLSPREFEIYKLLVEGHSVADIAKQLDISPKTSGVHHTRIMQKLKVNNRAQLVQIALRNGDVVL